MTKLPRTTVTRDATSGVVLIAAALGEVVLMSHHPSPAGHGTEAFLEHVVRIAGPDRAVHGGMIASVLLSTFGFTGFARAAGIERPGVRLGLVAWASGALALTLAALCNGFAVPALAERFAGSTEPATLAGLRAALAWSLAWNRSLAALGLLATSAAVGAWSWGLVRRDGAWRWIGVAGLVVGAGVPALFLAGELRLDVRGFGLFVLAQGLWSVAVGVRLVTGGAARTRSA